VTRFIPGVNYLSVLECPVSLSLYLDNILLGLLSGDKGTILVMVDVTVG
jgi:hypothetical protein